MSHLRPNPPERLSLAHVYVQTFRILGRDFLAIMALAFLVNGVGVAAEGWLLHSMHADLARRQTAVLIPWLVGFIPVVLADAGIVWVALRRLGGAARPSLRGALAIAAVALGVDLVENAPDFIEQLIPDRWLQARFVPDALDYYPVVLLIAGAFWLSLWLPALAVAVDQGVGGSTSLGRALSLTSGHRGGLFSLVLSLQLALMLGTYLIAVGFERLGLGWLPPWTADIAVAPIWAVSSITQAVVYWELTRLKTGLAPAGAATVFD